MYLNLICGDLRDVSRELACELKLRYHAFNGGYCLTTYWHILSKSRWEEKQQHAALNGGEFLFCQPELSKDISNGKIGSFIYLLPRLGGACLFTEPHEEIVALEIHIHLHAKILNFRGNPDEIQWESIRSQYDGVDMTVDTTNPGWPVKFRQIVLWNPRVIRHFSPENAIPAMYEDMKAIERGDLRNNDFFLIDRSPKEQLAEVRLLIAKMLETKQKDHDFTNGRPDSSNTQS